MAYIAWCGSSISGATFSCPGRGGWESRASGGGRLSGRLQICVGVSRIRASEHASAAGRSCVSRASLRGWTKSLVYLPPILEAYRTGGRRQVGRPPALPS
eukprot:scaffold16444_cov29-Tisochrysis_lutea.AAC.1